MPMPRIRAETVEAHRRRIREALLDAWGSLMEEHGFAEITMAMVAERAGVARNTIYGYFPDKEHLLLAHLEREIERFLAGVTAAMDAAVGRRRGCEFCSSIRRGILLPTLLPVMRSAR